MFHRTLSRSLLVLLALAALLIGAVPLSVAQGQAALPAGPYLIDLAPGASAEIPVYGFCLDPEKPFPIGPLELVDASPDPIRLTALYALTKGYIASDAYQVQLAIWYFVTGQRVPGKTYGPVAEEIIAFVEAGAPLPDVGVSASALHNAKTAGLVSVTLTDFERLGDLSEPGYYGQGTMVVTSLVDYRQQLLVPYGLRFKPVEHEETQQVVVFPQVPAVPRPTPTPTPPVTPPSLPPTGQLLPTPALIGFAVLAAGGLAGSLRRLARR
jgi:hypothetical protein